MNTTTSWIDYWNRKVRRLKIVDVKLVQVASMAAVLVLVKLFPEIMSLSVWCFVALWVICILRPAYVFWFEDGAEQPVGGGRSRAAAPPDAAGER